MSDSNGYARDADDNQVSNPPSGKLLGRSPAADTQIDIQLSRNPGETTTREAEYAPPTEAFFRGSQLHDHSATTALRAHLRSVGESRDAEIDEVIFTPGRLLFLSGEPVHVVRCNGNPVAFFSEGTRAPSSSEIRKAERYAATQPVYMRDKPKFVEVQAHYVERGAINSTQEDGAFDTRVILRDSAICAVLHEGVSQTLIDHEGKVTSAYIEGWLMARQFKGYDLAESDHLLCSTREGDLFELLVAAIPKRSAA
jgi:hypothetical protein